MGIIYTPPSSGGASAPSVAASGSIKYLVAGMSLPAFSGNDGFDLSDSLSTTAEFRWSMGGGGSAGPGTILCSSGPTAATMATRTATAINGYPGLEIVATVDPGDSTRVLLTQAVAGAAGNGSIDLTFGNTTPELTVVNFSGGSGSMPGLTAADGLRRAENLADLASAATARTALGVGYLRLYTGFHSLAVGEPVGVSPGYVAKVHADSESLCRSMVGIIASTESQHVNVAVAGQTMTLSGVLANVLYYVSPSGAGSAITQTQPSVTGQVVRLAGIGVATDTLLVVSGDLFLVP